MEMLGKVKRLYSRDNKSLHEIAKTTGPSRNTIRKWVRETKGDVKPVGADTESTQYS
jgi:transposase-like protein